MRLKRVFSLGMSFMMLLESGVIGESISLAAAEGGASEIELMEEEEYNTFIEVEDRRFIISGSRANYDVYGVREGEVCRFSDEEETFDICDMQIARKKVLDETDVYSLEDLGKKVGIVGRYI